MAMRISAQKLYNTAKAGDHGLLAFMLECKDTAQNFSWAKLLDSARECPDADKKFHTQLIIGKHHDVALRGLCHPVENYDVSTKLYKWKGIPWEPTWDEMLFVWMESGSPLTSLGWARAAYINDKPLEYVMQLIFATSNPCTDAERQSYSAHVIKWEHHYGQKRRAEWAVPMLREIEFIHLLESRNVPVCDQLVDYAWQCEQPELGKQIFSHLIRRRVVFSGQHAGALNIMRLAQAHPAVIREFLQVQDTAVTTEPNEDEDE